MARIKLSMPSEFIFSCNIPVRIADINYGNHVGNDAFVSIIHEVRMQWLKQFGVTELNIEGAVGFIMADLAIEFKAECFYGDIVEVQIAVAEINKISFEMYYQLSVERPGNKIIIANAKTGLVCYDYDLNKVAPIPPIVLAALGI